MPPRRGEKRWRALTATVRPPGQQNGRNANDEATEERLIEGQPVDLRL